MSIPTETIVDVLYRFRLDCQTDAQTDDPDHEAAALAAHEAAMLIAKRLGVLEQLQRVEQAEVDGMLPTNPVDHWQSLPGRNE